MYTCCKDVCNTCLAYFKPSSRHNVQCCPHCEQVYYCSFECACSHRLDTYHSPRECDILQHLRYPLRTRCSEDDLLVLKVLVRIACRKEVDRDPTQYTTFLFLADHLSDGNNTHRVQVERILEIAKEAEGDENRGFLTEPGVEVRAVISKIASNFFGIWTRNGNLSLWSGASVYLRASYFNHSCFPNCTVVQESNPHLQLDRRNVGAVFTVHSLCTIRQGEPLCVAYIPLEQTTEARQQALHQNWYFQCDCARCKDPESDNKPLSPFCCAEPGCYGGLLIPCGEAEAQPQQPQAGGSEERIMGMCRLCRTYAHIPIDRDLFERKEAREVP